MKNLMVVTGLMCSGKDTLRVQLKALIRDTDYLKNVNLITMHTTRSARKNEVYGEDYYFETEDYYFHCPNHILVAAIYHPITNEDWYYWIEGEDLSEDENTINIVFTGMRELAALLRDDYLGELNLNLYPVILEISLAEILKRSIKRSNVSDEALEETLRRVREDMKDFEPEVLANLGITGEHRIESDLNTLPNLLIRINKFQQKIKQKIK